MQILLSQSGYSPGEIDGKWGGNTRAALLAFQREHDLDTSGDADEATRTALEEQAGDSLMRDHTLTDEDVAGPFLETVPDDLMKQSKLDHLSYATVDEKLAEQFHVSPALLRELNPDSSFEAGETLRVPAVTAPEQEIDSASVTVTVRRDTEILNVRDADGTLLFHAPVTAGSERFPLPIGEWSVVAIAHEPTFHYDPALFGDDMPEDHEEAPIAAGPNNPVGTVWIDLSKEHYGLHGTPEPSKIGYASSHGCVRLTNWDAERVAAMVGAGTKVVFAQ